METLIAQFQEIFADEEKMRTFLMMVLVLAKRMMSKSME